MGCGSSAATSGASNPSKPKKGGVVLGYYSLVRGGPRGNMTKYVLNYCGVQYTDVKYPITDGLK